MTDQPDLKARVEEWLRQPPMHSRGNSGLIEVEFVLALLSRITDLEAERDDVLKFAGCDSLSQLASAYSTAQANWDLTLDRAEAAESRLALADRLEEAGRRWVLARQVALTLTDKLPSDEFKQAWHELGESEWAMSAALTAQAADTSARNVPAREGSANASRAATGPLPRLATEAEPSGKES